MCAFARPRRPEQDHNLARLLTTFILLQLLVGWLGCIAVDAITTAGKICVLDIDMQGVRKVRRSELPAPVYVFVRPPSMEALEERLRARGTDDEDTIARRMRAAQDEMEYAAVEGNFDAVFVNDHLEDAYEQILEYLRTQYPGML